MAGEFFPAMRPVIVQHQRHLLAVIHSGARELLVAEGKAERTHEVQTAACIRAKAHNVACVGGDFGLEQNDLEHVPVPANLYYREKTAELRPRMVHILLMAGRP
jgi:hypothetical protein